MDIGVENCEEEFRDDSDLGVSIIFSIAIAMADFGACKTVALEPDV